MSTKNFAELGNTIFTIASKLLENEQLLKLLYYTNDNPLSQSAITEEQKQDILSKNILVTPDLPEQTDTIYPWISIGLDNIENDNNNERFNTVQVIFTVVCPLSLWKIKNGSLRPFLIMSCIDSLLNGKSIPGIGKVVLMGAKRFTLNREISGYTIVYEQEQFNA